MQNIYGICQLCWCQLSDFHTFYGNIERAHRRCIERFPIVKQPVSNCNSKIKDIQIIPFQILKDDFNEDSDFSIDKIEDEIEFKDNPNGKETLLCVPNVLKACNERDCIPIYTEKSKNKRGRPRKIYDSNEIIIKKPKRKPGRPRKSNLDRNEKLTSFKNDSSVAYKKLVKQHTHPSKHKLDKKPPHLKTVKIGRPTKIKRSRGRPRKEQQIKNETINSTAAVTEFVTTANNKLVNEILSSTNQGEIIKDLNETKKLVHKKHTLLKNRKRIQQHKALMRNYIATSVRCMKFLKLN